MPLTFTFTFTFSLMLVGFGNFVFAEKYSDPVVIFETNLGNITIEFFSNDAPKHVENFIELWINI